MASQKFTAALQESLKSGGFIKLALGHYKGAEPELKNIYIRKIVVRGEEKLSFTYRYKTRDIVKNYAAAEALEKIAGLLEKDFRHALLHTAENDVLLDLAKKPLFKKMKPTQQPADTEHNRAKNYIVRADAPYLQALNIADGKGNVLKTAQDKYRQINRYIEILGGLVKGMQIKNVVDMGAGKGYLTFSFYDYLHRVLQQEANVIGVEYRADMVTLCNDLARQAGFKRLRFVEGTIRDYKADAVDMLIALHACDTATDEAIFKGITAGAQLIVCAPCCHKQVRREMEKNAAANDLDFLTRHGIFMERQAEMATDGLRALILEYFGYKTKIFEFVSDAHTAKNVMIVGVKAAKSAAQKEKIRAEIAAAKAYFGIARHHLEDLMGLG